MRVSERPRRAGGDDLGAIDQLEDAGDAEISGGEHQRSRVGRVGAIEEDADQRPRRHEEERGGEGHEANAHGEAGPAGEAHAFGIAAAGGVADTHGGGDAEAERHHEGGGGELQRHGVGSDLVGAEAAHAGWRRPRTGRLRRRR